ncbi:MBL fold metallo-hydrolase [Roseomonas sp. HF4]|uniref:MBL fold metallo-hydrolase n=1 Tax=Roseomonas sp. HF4 TaxID=2562313 RepID=UPI0019821811|nr:MBL fold metallo-hydrolase [Roseomonas sp. HF4]
MYRHGLGDCFLLTLPRTDGAGAFRIMIDCGVLLGTPDAEARMRAVAQDIAAQSGGHVDLLIVTHEHWDHVSGFLQARDALAAISFGAVWMGWTENPADRQAKALLQRRSQAITALRMADSRLRLAGAEAVAEEVGGLLAFFGAGGRGATTADALEAARALGAPDRLRYVEPGEPPTPLPGTDARIFVLGPPRDEALLLRSTPSRRTPETYHLAFGAGSMEEVQARLAGEATEGPFAEGMSIPMQVARAMPDFARYWGAEESWRRIDADWMDAAAELALRLDADTNNTSLAVAIELADGDVLLFAADAQVGNWLSWETLAWDDGGRRVTGPDLLARTVFYKVGHHGSHNATLREKGLETMRRLRIAAIPVDEAMARKRRWNAMPLPGLVARLEEMTGGRLLRSDRPAPTGIEALTEDDLFFAFPP